MFNRVFLFFFIVSTVLVHAQQDSIDYKVEDSRYFYEEDLFCNNIDIFNLDSTLHYIDTSITKLHQYEMWYRDGNISQDLGSIGSSVKPIYYSAPKTLGLTSGHTGFDPFAFKNSEVKYFDTKRPYSNLDVIMGGNGRQFFKADFGRNIDERSSFGLVFRRLTSIDPIGSNPSKDPFANHYSAQVFFNYHTKNQRYYLLANYRWVNHRLFETGGVKVDSTLEYPDAYFSDVAQPNLTQVTSNDRRNNWHIYQQFNVFDSSTSLQLFHVFDREKQKYQYLDEGLENNLNYYPNIYNDSTITNDSSSFEVIANKAGVKGSFKGLNYTGYLFNRLFYHSRNDSVNYSNYENYAGGSLGYNIDDLDFGVSGDFMIMLNGEYSHIGLEAKYKGLKFSYSDDVYSPSMLSQEYFGNHYLWLKTFNAIQSTSYKLSYRLRLKKFIFQPELGIDQIQDLVYYDSTSNPYQEEGIITAIYLGAKFSLDFKKIGWRGFGKYYEINSDLLRAPKLFLHNQVYLKGKLFNNVMDFETGIDIYYRSSYKGYGYQAVTQQFILQDSELFWDTWIIDLYFNFKVKNLTLFFKINHVNRGLGSNNGYLSTAGYPGQRRAIGFGVRWKLFD